MTKLKLLAVLITGIVIAFFIIVPARSQGIDWTHYDPEVKERFVLLQDQMAAKNYEQASIQALYLLEKAPDVHRNLYIYSNKILVYELKEKTSEKKLASRYSLFDLYEMRKNYFSVSNNNKLRLAMDGYRYYQKDSTYYDPLFAALQLVFQDSSINTPSSVPVAYWDISLKQYGGKKITREELSAIFWQVSGFYSEEGEEGSDKLSLVMTLLVKRTAMTCDEVLAFFSEEVWGEAYKARTVLTVLNVLQCSEHPLYAEALTWVNALKPNAKVSIYLSSKLWQQGKREEAMAGLKAALAQLERTEERFAIVQNLSTYYFEMGEAGKARQLLLQAEYIQYDETGVFTLLGDLYFNSYEQCKNRKSVVEDRMVFFAAFEAYQRANNKAKMAMAAQQFPSMEYIHQEGYALGEQHSCHCWINETVTIRRLQ